MVLKIKSLNLAQDSAVSIIHLEKNGMKRFFGIKNSLLLLSGLLLQTGLFAAPGPPPMGGPPCWPPPCLPIDGGVLFLMIAGILLGGWKIYSSFYKKKAA
jgi:hypothetical protein